MIIEAQFRKIVVDRLKEIGWTRADLARAMEKPPQFVTNYLNGKTSPGPVVMERFFEALGIRPVLSFEELPKPAS